MRRLVPTFQEHGIIRGLDLMLGTMVQLMASRFYRHRGRGYGILEALLFPRAVDVWSREATVAEAVTEQVYGSMLDVGTGPRGGVIQFLSVHGRRVCSLDRRKSVFETLVFRSMRGRKDMDCVVGDGRNLPFRDESFDIVTSVSNLEHIPAASREGFLRELLRVARHRVVLHFPADSDDGSYRGGEYDVRFNEWHRAALGGEDRNTSEHIRAGHPRLEDVARVLPMVAFKGTKNCDVWLRHMTFSRRPFIGFLTGLLYYFVWKRKDRRPPYYEVLVVVERDGAAAEQKGV
jgi:hypothetical protein